MPGGRRSRPFLQVRHEANVAHLLRHLRPLLSPHYPPPSPGQVSTERPTLCPVQSPFWSHPDSPVLATSRSSRSPGWPPHPSLTRNTLLRVLPLPPPVRAEGQLWAQRRDPMPSPPPPLHLTPLTWASEPRFCQGHPSISVAIATSGSSWKGLRT